MRLINALQPGSPARIAFTGAGGKTAAMFRLSRELTRPVLVTATTHFSMAQTRLADRWVEIQDASQIKAAWADLADVTLFTGAADQSGRTAGLAPECLERLFRLAEEMGLPVLVEADGSRQRPLKAPADHEPVVPGWARQVVVVAGLSGLGQRLNAEAVHRPEIFSRLSGLPMEEAVTLEALERVLNHPSGGLKAIPAGAARIALLNQADFPGLLAAGQQLALRLLPAFDKVIVGSLGMAPEDEAVKAVYTSTAGVVLAAGGASRFGAPKQLLDWRGQPLVRHVARLALRAGLDPVVVVLGAHRAEVRHALDGLRLILVENQDWQTGQSSSIRGGLCALPDKTGAAIFLLCDQPQVPERLLASLVEMHRQTLAPIISPQVDGKRANPVLFDRQTFADLLALQGDVGGRGLFSKYPVTWVEWLDRRLALDIDTPEDYRRLLEQMDD
jgi:molybdenum cofactor cytidylyltransferase